MVADDAKHRPWLGLRSRRWRTQVTIVMSAIASFQPESPDPKLPGLRFRPPVELFAMKTPNDDRSHRVRHVIRYTRLMNA